MFQVNEVKVSCSCSWCVVLLRCSTTHRPGRATTTFWVHFCVPIWLKSFVETLLGYFFRNNNQNFIYKKKKYIPMWASPKITCLPSPHNHTLHLTITPPLHRLQFVQASPFFLLWLPSSFVLTSSSLSPKDDKTKPPPTTPVALSVPSGRNGSSYLQVTEETQNFCVPRFFSLWRQNNLQHFVVNRRATFWDSLRRDWSSFSNSWRNFLDFFLKTILLCFLRCNTRLRR